MLYVITFMFMICGFIKLFQGNMSDFFIFQLLGGIYLIPAIISDTYLKFYKTMCTALEKSEDFMKEFNNKIKQEKEKQDEEK